MIIKSCLVRGDRRKAERILGDWLGRNNVSIMQWVPGTHYYVKDRKFDTYELAADYARSIGLTPQGVRYRYV